VKFLRKIFDNAHHSLNKSEKTKKFFPLVDALDTLLFTPNHTAGKSGAHLRDAIDLKRTMMIVIIALIPCLLFGMYNVGYQHFRALGLLESTGFGDIILHGIIRVLPLVIVSYAAGLAVEFVFAIKNGHSVQEGFLVSGMLIPLIMPVDVPLWMVAVATIFAVIFAKEVFGGTGMNVMNVALTARAFLFFAYPTKMSGDIVWTSGLEEMQKNGTQLADGITGATSLGDLAASRLKYADAVIAKADGKPYEQLIEEGNKLGERASSMWDSFLGLEVGSVGETSALMCLIGAALLLKTGIASWRVMIGYFLGGLAISGLLFVVSGDINNGGNPFFAINPIHQLMLGGFMFGMVFMITDPVTASQTNTGKYIYGFLGGLLGILIRMLNPAYPEGVMLGILIANVCAPTIDYMVINANVKRRMKRLKTA
jgi:Na+-transporting NADH:ubiquinone oxidoreductase subunit B